MLVFILGLLFLLGMFYVKRRLDTNDKRLDLLTDTIQTMAGIRMEEIDKVSDEDESEEEEEEEEDESEEEEEEEEKEELKNFLWTEDKPILPWDRITETTVPDQVDGEITELRVLTLEDPEVKLIQLPKTTVSDDDVTEFDGLTLKELKEKVAELDGPKLKTKRECIDFLKIKSKKEI